MKWEAAIHNLDWDYTHWGPEEEGFKDRCLFVLPSICPSVCELFIEAVTIDVSFHRYTYLPGNMFSELKKREWINK